MCAFQVMLDEMVIPRYFAVSTVGSFLNNRMQLVILDGESSSKLPVVRGVY
jgi:uncharacterized membrane protein